MGRSCRFRRVCPSLAAPRGARVAKMRNLILAVTLLATPALAQTPPATPSQLGHGRPAPAKPKAPPTVQAPHAPAKAPPPAKPKPHAPPPVAVPAPAPVPTPQAAPVATEPGKGSVTGQPLPRWAALRSDEVNLRAGPGTRYPIDWVYHRRDLPVQIEREFDAWRLIEDQDGVKGWVHSATLAGRRGFVIKTGDQTLRKSAADDAAAVATLRTGVAGRLRGCAARAAWCEVEAGGYRGWLKREAIWGIFPDEVVN